MILVSNDCWGNNWYKSEKAQYNTPFIGIFVPPKDFVDLILNIDCIYDPIRFLPNKPVTGIVGESRLVFLHYSSQEEAKTKWTRRLERFKSQFNESKVIFKLSIMTTGVYRQYPTSNYMDVLSAFHSISEFSNKISFCDDSLGIQPNFPNHFAIKQEMAEDAVSLWNITKQWPSIKKIFTEVNKQENVG